MLFPMITEENCHRIRFTPAAFRRYKKMLSIVDSIHKGATDAFLLSEFSQNKINKPVNHSVHSAWMKLTDKGYKPTCDKCKSTSITLDSFVCCPTYYRCWDCGHHESQNVITTLVKGASHEKY